MYCWKQVSKIRHKTYKILKYLLGADKMAQFGEFNAQNPCEKQLSVMHTRILALGKWRQVEPCACFNLVYVKSSKPVKDPCWIKVGAPEEHPSSFAVFHTHAPMQINKYTHTQKVKWITIKCFTVKILGSHLSSRH